MTFLKYNTIIISSLLSSFCHSLSHCFANIDFVTVWADNADACSVQYAGTGALKTDFTRYYSQG